MKDVMSVKTRLIGIILALGLAVLGFAGTSLLAAWREAENAAHAQNLAKLDSVLTRGMNNVRYERGATTSALTLEAAGAAPTLTDMAARRKSVDEALSSATGLTRSSLSGESTLDLSVIADLYQRWTQTRRDVDDALTRPVSARDLALTRKVGEQALDLQRSIEALIAKTEKRIREVDTRFSNLLRVRQLGWEARSSAGSATVIVIDVLAKGQVIAPNQLIELHALERETKFIFQMMQGIVESMNGREPLKLAIRTAQSRYFDGVLADRTRTIVPALSDKSLERTPVDAYRTQFNPGLDQLAEIVLTSVSELDAMAQATADEARRHLLWQALLCLSALVLVVGGVIWVVRGVVNPITAMTGIMARLARADLGTEIPFRQRRDEIGAMAAAVQVFKDNLIRTRQLEEETALARASAEEQRKRAMREMADGFEAAVGNVIAMVSSSASDLQATASTMSGTAAATAAQSTAVAAAAEEAASNVTTVAAAAEELGSSVREIGRQVSGSAELAHRAVAEADQTGALVQELSGAVSRIGDVIGLISSIAEQTNLLALNATIEAARAGAAGKGFAVVAGEVKALAGQTARATSEISAQIEQIQASTGQAVASIGGITARIREINAVAASIAAAVEQQGAATQEIVRNVSHAAAGAGEVTGNIAGVAGAAEETGAAASEVLAASSALSRQSEHLTAEVDRFLATVRAA
ncbi:hypothetical protein VQ03_14525 [Methylobacterium tarhaniae]|uniref:Chemotaxis protein n=1 Tax=Methylobacterium tarhaniae TaxID=1187852 RepID=A0A0J6VM43_9HYPH|nr:methyl-accepting chemotaxis protein [Methylobacterium tarhaniae]KMO40241.1 hypothetical protein VQ03_14525 [Methylobacterium tarhaniae]